MQQTTPTNKRSSQEEQSDIFTLIRSRYVPYWPLFLVAILAALLIAFIYLQYVTPMYKITATLLVKDEKKGIDESKIMESLDLFGSKKIVENEVEVLQSRTLTKEVINRLQLYGDILQQDNLRKKPLYRNAPVAFQFLQPDSIKQKTTVPLQVNLTTRRVSIDGVPYPMNDTVKTPWGKMIILPTREIADANAVLYLRITPVKEYTQALLKALKVKPISKLSSVINLEYDDAVPARGEDILNELINVYNKAAIEDKNKLAHNTMAFVEDRLSVVTGELTQVEAEVERFKTSKGIVDISEQSKLFLESVKDNDEKISEANLQLSVLDAIERNVTGTAKGQDVVPATLGLSDPVLLGLISKLQETSLQIEALKKTTGENSPLLESLNNQVSRLTPAILENIRSLKSNLLAGKEKLDADNSRFVGLLQNVPKKERSLLDISRQQVIKNDIYTFLLQKREETALSYAAAVEDSRIVDQAESASRPFTPKWPMTIAMAIGIAIAVVTVSLYLKELMNRHVVFRADIENVTSAPIIGEIMYDNSGTPVVIGDGKRTHIAEQFRALRTSLAYVGINRQHKTILITSSLSGEGKSFISINLAISLSLNKKRVVLLELDLRKPRISEMLQVSREPGISNYLVNQTTLENILHPVAGNSYFYLLPAGIIPPNPTELIMNGRLEEMLQELRESFDYIIIDTAPVGPVTDARLLAAFADTTLYVIRHQKTPKACLKMIENMYQEKELGKMNIIFNGIKQRGVTGYGYGYGYGQGYTEGYSDELKEKESVKPQKVL